MCVSFFFEEPSLVFLPILLSHARWRDKCLIHYWGNSQKTLTVGIVTNVRYDPDQTISAGSCKDTINVYRFVGGLQTQQGSMLLQTHRTLRAFPTTSSVCYLPFPLRTMHRVLGTCYQSNHWQSSRPERNRKKKQKPHAV